jgi:branched-chain amino acid transport system ATP-binding protein
MCAIARAVMRQPRMLMLDEPSLGLSPLMVERVFELVAALVSRKSLTVLLVEQNVGDALQMAARGYVVEHGRVVRTGSGRELLDDPAVRRAYLGLD